MLIHDSLDFWTRRDPQRQLIADGKQSLTREAFTSRTRRMANLLAEHLEPGDRVAIVGKNSIDYLALYYASSRAGVVPVPVNYRLAPPEWRFIIDDAESRMVIADTEFAAGIQTVRNELEAPQHFLGLDGAIDGWEAFDDAVNAQPDTPPDHRGSADDLVYQMYTSGTTGLPKGAMLSQGAVIAHMQQLTALTDVVEEPCTLIVVPMYHAAGAVTGINTISQGGSILTMADFVPSEVARVLSEEGITNVTLVPAMIQALLVMVPELADLEFPRLETIVYGASPIAVETLRAAASAFGCKFVQGYGMTETTAILTALFAEDHERALAGDEHLLTSAGRPILATEVRIIDAEGNDLPTGEVGEIIGRGPQLMEGYHNRPEASATALADGWMHTGDAGSLDEEGYLYVSDRVKDMIISGGENVYPREIEDVIFQLPAVADAAVIGVPDEKWGETVKAVVQVREGESLTVDEVLDHCRANLGGFKQPRSVDFIDAIPRNLSGKVLKKDLRAPYWEGSARAVN
ncbi:MAG TPA: long-chain-fatty-acid--CoA ligase [Acidimicrobiales bacterium]|nr:long-chain-fatty-acid--CoA ligase [Acidimicrobiales bacterium]